jgi:hypothetical protein
MGQLRTSERGFQMSALCQKWTFGLHGHVQLKSYIFIENG